MAGPYPLSKEYSRRRANEQGIRNMVTAWLEGSLLVVRLHALCKMLGRFEVSVNGCFCCISRACCENGSNNTHSRYFGLICRIFFVTLFVFLCPFLFECRKELLILRNL